MDEFDRTRNGGDAPPVKYYQVHRTASFKLHNPTKRKQTILNFALTEYTIAYSQLLDWASANRDTLEPQIIRLRDDGRLSWIGDKGLAGILRTSGIRPNVHGSLAESLYLDVAGNLLSYYRLYHNYREQAECYLHAVREAEARGETLKRKPPSPPSFPISRDPRAHAFGEALDEIGATGDVDEETWLYRQARLTRLQRGRYMPLCFSRPDAVPNYRNFSLLADDEHGRYYALLFLLPNKHELGQPIAHNGNLRRVGHPATATPPYDPVYFASRTTCAVLCPLEMSDWHVTEFIQHPSANVRSAFLFERNGDYFLNVAFEYTVQAIPTQAVLGVDRGVAQFAALRVLDAEARVLHEELWSGDKFLALQWDIKKTLRRLQKRGRDVTGLVRISRISEQTVHALANAILELARQYQAQVVLEKLKYLDRQKERFVKLRATPYQRIAAVLEYKLPLHGLPPPAYVSPACTSRMCARCTYGDSSNRPDQETFVCQQCGHTDHADLNAATNIARRWLARQQGQDWWPHNIASKRVR